MDIFTGRDATGIRIAHDITEFTVNSWSTSLIRGARILVPIQVDALVVYPPGFYQEVPAYYVPTAIAPSWTMTSGKPEPKPDGTSLLFDPFALPKQRDPGIYLHWALPSALTRADASSDGPIPAALPDRWLISRIASGTDSSKRGVQSWVLRATDLNPVPKALADFLETGPDPMIPTSSPPPSILGNDVTWAAYYDNVVNRLGFYDSLTSVTGPVAYLVCGWYSDSTYDPLAQRPFWEVNLAAYNWTLSSSDSGTFGRTNVRMAAPYQSLGLGTPAVTNAALPCGILLHGAIVGLGWPQPTLENDPAVPVRTGGPPSADSLKVSLGSTQAEAFATLFADDPTRVADDARLLEAMHLGILRELEDPAGPAKLDELLHASGFQSAALSPPTTAVVSAINATLPQPPSGPNAATEGVAPNVGTVGVAVRPMIPRTIAEGTLHETIGNVTPIIKNVAAASIVNAEPGPDSRTVTRSAPRWFLQHEPVLAILGGGRSFKHGYDTRFADGTLACRATGSYVTAINFPSTLIPSATPVAGRTINLSASELVAQTDRITNGSVPPECDGLLLEAITLDPGSANAFAQILVGQFSVSVVSTLVTNIATEQTAWWKLRDPSVAPSVIASHLALVGELPSPIAITPPIAPWNPRHVAWAVSYIHSPGGIEAWCLEELDFVPAGIATGESESRTLLERRLLDPLMPTFVGRAVLTGGIAKKLQAEVQNAYAALPAGDQQLANIASLLNQLSSIDLCAGALDGFTAALRGDKHGPIAGKGTGPYVTPGIPLRAGSAYLSQLRIVDGFGQFIDLFPAPPLTQSQPVLVAPSMTLPGQPQLFALPPRPTAPAQLWFRFIDPSSSVSEHVYADGSINGVSPVCGFLVPNHIDQALAFYDASGSLNGELRIADDGISVVWESAPGLAASVGQDPGSLPNSQLAAIARGLVAASASMQQQSESPLLAMLRVIDSTLWTVDPFAHSGEEHMALLIGHPIVVVRAALRIQTYQFECSRSRFPVRIGSLANWEDGVLGYYVDGDPHFHAIDAVVTKNGRQLAPGSGFLGPVTTANTYDVTTPTPVTHEYIDSTGTLYITPWNPFEIGGAEAEVGLTLLVEPFNSITATAGIVPRKSLSLLRGWIQTGLAAIAPAFRFGPVILEPRTTKLPISTDIPGTWAWTHRAGPATWANDPAVTVTADAHLVLSKNPNGRQFSRQQCPRAARVFVRSGIVSCSTSLGHPHPQGSGRKAATRNGPRVAREEGRRLMMSTPSELALRRPHGNSSSAFRPAAGGTGSLHHYRRQTHPR